MKRTRFGSRDRLSREAAELQRLAIGLSESGGKLEDHYWEEKLAEAVDSLLQDGAEDDINTALDRLFEANPRGHDELADMVESRKPMARHSTSNSSQRPSSPGPAFPSRPARCPKTRCRRWPFTSAPMFLVATPAWRWPISCSAPTSCRAVSATPGN